MLLVAGSAAAWTPVPGLTPELLAKARDHGVVRVIVQLRVAPGADAAQIETAKGTVLAQIAATRHRIVRELRGLPSVALEASEETLRLLSVSPHVSRVQEDLPERPMR